MKLGSIIVCLASFTIGCGSAAAPVNAKQSSNDGGTQDEQYPNLLGDGSIYVAPDGTSDDGSSDGSTVFSCSSGASCPPTYVCQSRCNVGPVCVPTYEPPVNGEGCPGNEVCEGCNFGGACGCVQPSCQQVCNDKLHSCENGNDAPFNVDCRNGCEREYKQCIEKCSDGGCR